MQQCNKYTVIRCEGDTYSYTSVLYTFLLQNCVPTNSSVIFTKLDLFEKCIVLYGMLYAGCFAARFMEEQSVRSVNLAEKKCKANLSI